MLSSCATQHVRMTKALALAGCLWMAGCGTQRSPQFATASKLPDEPRKPDGVALDLDANLAPSALVGDTSQGVIALRQPADPEQAVAVVRSFFRAVAQEDAAKLQSTLAENAWAGGLGSGGGPPAQALWNQRFRRLDYTSIGAQTLFREKALQVYGYRDLLLASGDRPAMPSQMLEGDLLIRVPLTLTRIGNERLFGDEMQFLLRPGPGGYVIEGLQEDFSPP